MSIRYITCAKRRGNKSRENVEVWGKMAARHAEKCGGSKAPSFQRRSFNRAKDALLFKLLRRTRKREREIDRLSCVSSQPSCLKRIYTLTCIIYLYYIIILFSFKMDKMRVSFHFCIFMM